MTCELPSGWNEITAHKPRYIIFGEIHGTNESPQFVGSIACALAYRGNKILIALELDATDNKQLQAAWRSSDIKFERELLKRGWSGRDDGVASMSMKNMLVQLHRLLGPRGDISIVAFNGYDSAAQEARLSKLQGQQGHEIGQAENIQAASRQKKYDYILILVGNIHARKTEVSHGGQSFKPMAMQLAPPDEVVALNMATSGGSAWNCIPKQTASDGVATQLKTQSLECAAHPYRSEDRLKENFPTVGLGPFSQDPDNASYDGYFWLGHITGSPPAVQK